MEWLPFLLNPNQSEEGENIIDHVVKKYGPGAADSFNDPNSSLKTMGRKMDIKFNNDRMMVNTKRAHALVEELKVKVSNDKANAFMVDLYKGYFEDAENINDEALLISKVQKYGLNEDDAKMAMNANNLGEIAKKDQAVKSEFGVNGVPFFMIHPNSGGLPVAFSGAQPPEVIAEQLQKAASDSK